jgi:hypothetical protein
MSARVRGRTKRWILILMAAIVALPGTGLAHGGGGGGGGGHGGGSMGGGGHGGGMGMHGGGGFHGGGMGMHGNSAAFHGGAGFHGSSGFHGSVVHANPAFHGGARNGFNNGFHNNGFHNGFHSGFHNNGFNNGFHNGFHSGFHHGFNHFHNGHFHNGRFFFGSPFWGWGWGWGALAIGTFVATLPLYYNTFWWGGVPYYSYNNTYYRWNDSVGQYEVVPPPAGADAGANASANDNTVASTSSDELYVYPMSGQNEQQQKDDRYACHSWAVNQSGFDPTAGAANDTSRRDNYLRAEGACLEGRGYTVQ